jgi:hypothetical protein
MPELYEEVVATPRIVDREGRRCAPDAAITLPIVRRQSSTSVRSPPTMASETALALALETALAPSK